MEVDEIIETVTRNVLAKFHSGNKKVLLLASRRPVLLGDLTARLRGEYPSHEFVLFVPETDNPEPDNDAALTCCGIRRLSFREAADGFMSFEAVFLVSPGLKLMESITKLDDTEMIPYLFLNSLLYQKRTGLLAGWELDQPSRNPLARKVAELFSDLGDLGVEIVKSNDNGEKTVQTLPGKTMNQATHGRGELITESKIKEFWEAGLLELSCEKGCIITALARDKAKELGLKILFES